MRLLILVAVPGLVFGTMVRAFIAREPACARGGRVELLDGFHALGAPPCPPTDYAVLVGIGLIAAVAVIAHRVVGARGT